MEDSEVGTLLNGGDTHKLREIQLLALLIVIFNPLFWVSHTLITVTGVVNFFQVLTNEEHESSMERSPFVVDLMTNIGLECG